MSIIPKAEDDRPSYASLIDPENLNKEERCLAEAVYFEARSEPEDGQAAVAQVVLNRVKSGLYPTSVCGVVYQNRHRKFACQFSFACEGKSLRINEAESWKPAVRVAREVTFGQTYNEDVGAATHYHANYVRPFWAKRLKKMDVIGRHIFYSLEAGADVAVLNEVLGSSPARRRRGKGIQGNSKTVWIPFPALRAAGDDHVAIPSSRSSISSPRSSTLAECVSAPTEIMSTPLSAMALTVSRFTPPDASVRIRPPTIATARRSRSGPMLSSSTTSAPSAITSASWSSVSTSISIFTRWPTAALAAWSAGRMPPATAMWLSLMRTASSRPIAVVRAAAALHGVFLEGAQAGRRLARADDAGVRAATPST